MAWQSPTTLESPLVYACELWVSASCPTLQGSIVSYAEVVPNNCPEYSLNFWGQPKTKKTHTHPKRLAEVRRSTM